MLIANYISVWRHAVIVFIVFISSLSYQADAGGCFGRMHKLIGLDGSLLRGHISNIQQDRNGFIWLATWNGLIRYDSYNTHTFKPIQNSNGTIDSNRIYNIKVSSDGRLWCVSSDNRLFLFDTDTYTFANLTKSIPEISDKKVKALTPLKCGATWITFRDNSCIRLNDISPEKEATFFQKASDILPGATRITGISLAENGDEWILTDNGALNFSKKVSFTEGKYHYVESLYKTTYLISRNGVILQPESGRKLTAATQFNITVNYIRTDGFRIILATNKGIISIDTRDGKPTQHSLDDTSYLFKDSRHRIWGFCRNNAITMIEDISKSKSVKLSSMPSSNEETMKNPQLIFETADCDIIAKPVGGKLSLYDESSRQFREISFSGTSTESYEPTNIKKFIIDFNHNLWVLRSDGVECMSFHRQSYTLTHNPSRSETRALVYDSRGRLWTADRSGLVTCSEYTIHTKSPAYTIKESPSKEIWIGTKGDGIYILSPVNGHNKQAFSIEHLTRNGKNGHSIHSDTIYDIAFDRGRIWLGSYVNGLAECTKDSDGHYVCKTTRNQPPGMKIRTIVPDGRGNLLLGTADGLVTTNAGCSDSPEFHINKFRAEKWGMKGNDVMSINQCDGSYYICVFGSGISRIDSENLLSDSLHFTTYQLPLTADAEQIYSSITTDKAIWVLSGGIVTRFSPRTGAMTSYRFDGLPDDIFFSEATPAYNNGLITTGTATGTLSFSPSELSNGSIKASVKISGILYQNDMRVKPLNSPTSITLSPDHRSFALLLSAMTFDDRDLIHLRYRLKGFDDGWNYTHGARPTATYSNLPPGDYQLIIESERDDGQWLTQAYQPCIIVTPRASETIWFRLGIMVIITCLLISMAAAAIHYKRMRNAVQRKYSLLLTVDRLSNDIPHITKNESPDNKPEQQKFLEASIEFLNKNIDNPNLIVEDFARHLGMSRTAYYNRMKEVTGVSPIDFIRQMRIKRALKHLETDNLFISEVAYMVGYSDPKYFSRCFKAEMGMTPSQYLTNSKLQK